MRIRRPPFSSAHAIALLALFVSLGGTVYAASTINGKTIRKASIPGNRLKPNSVKEAQVDESSLRIVPSAQRALEAARAEVADSATEAARAQQAAQAGEAAKAVEAAKATEALTAAKATEAAKAARADRATFAERAGDAETVEGLGPESLQRRCELGSVRAMVFVDPTRSPKVQRFFSCAGTSPRLDGVGDFGTAEWDLTFPNLTNAFVTAAAPGVNSAVSVSSGGPTFRIKVFSTLSGDRLPNEPFTVVAF